MALSTPDTIGNRYKVQEQIGAGGMGTVFRGIDLKNGTSIAIKALKSEVATDPSMIERFNREAEALRQLNHPNIVKVVDSISENDQHYIIMEYVSGGTLGDIIKTHTKLPIEDVLQIAIELADALTRAHYLKIIHRDLKPANVLITENQIPRLTDFGVAYIGKKERITQVDVAVGTPDYMSPEALNGNSVDVRTDIWSFGVMLFEMLTRRHPFAGDTLGHLITAILTQQPPDLEELRPDAPVQLVDLVYRMLDKDANARIPSVRLIGAELEMLIQGGIHGSTSSIYAARLPAETNRFVTPTPPTNEAKHNLPAQTTPFVGREPEIKALNQLVSNTDSRFITILGPGGMGKTRLALEVAREQVSQFYHGVYFVPLAPLERSENIIPTIAESIKFTFGQDPRGPKAQLLDHLSEKHMLLVMDNFEHVMDGADIVGEILEHAPDITIIVTSRERLRFSGETVFNLGGMDFPEWEIPEDALDYSAVKLFLQGAKRAQPGFELNNDDLTYVARIARLLQGMPLGILLAAAWIDSLSLKEITEEISENLDFLETDLRDVADRHRSMRAVFDYSWNLLTDTERDILTKLSIFRGGFEREAAQKIAGANLRNLTALVNKSLLTRSPEGRYTLHKLVQQYAEEKFDGCQESQDEVQAKHADYYGQFMCKIQQQFGTNNEMLALDAMDTELDNLRVSWRWAVGHGHWDGIEPIIHITMLFYQGRSMLLEGINTFRELAKALEANNFQNTPIYWKARSRQSWLAGRIADYETTWKYAKGSYDYFIKRDDPLECAYALNNMSYARMFQGKYTEAKQHALEASNWARQVDDKVTVWSSIANVGYVDYLNGDYEEAKRIYTDLLDNFNSENTSPIGRAFGLNNLGEIYQSLGDLRKAKSLFEEAHAVFSSHKHRRGMAFTMNNLAGVTFVLGKTQDAQQMYEHAYSLNKEIGDLSGIAHSISAIGNISFMSGDQSGALDFYTESLHLRRKLGDLRAIADSLGDLGNVALATDNPTLAQTYFEEKLDLCRKIGDRHGEGYALIGVGIALWLLDDKDNAEVYVDKSFTLIDEIGTNGMMIQALSTIGDIYLHKGDYETAQEFFYLGLRFGESLDSIAISAMPILGLATIISAEGNPNHALELVSMIAESDYSNIGFITTKINSLNHELCNLLDEKTAKSTIAQGKILNFIQTRQDLLRDFTAENQNKN